MASLIGIGLFCCILSIILIPSKCLIDLYYDDMADCVNTGWTQMNGGAMQMAGYVDIPGSTFNNPRIERQFNTYGYYGLYVFFELSWDWFDDWDYFYVYYSCDYAEYYQAAQWGSHGGPESFPAINVSIDNYADGNCTKPKTINIMFSVDINAGNSAHLDEVYIRATSTYSTSPPTPPYDNTIYVYNDMSDALNTGWTTSGISWPTVVEQSMDTSYCASPPCLSLTGYSHYITSSDIDTSLAPNGYTYLSYDIATSYDLGYADNGYSVVQYKCDSGPTSSFTTAVIHYAVSTSTNHVIVIPCISTTTTIRFLLYRSPQSDYIYIDNVCLMKSTSWPIGICPNTTLVTYDTGILWFDDFSNKLDHWYINSDRLGRDYTRFISSYPCTSLCAKMDGNSLITSQMIDASNAQYIYLQFDIATRCDRDLNDYVIVEYSCNINSIFTHLTTYYDDFEIKSEIMQIPCNYPPVVQIKITSSASRNDAFVYVDNVYICNGLCPGDITYNPTAGLILYDNMTTLETWMSLGYYGSGSYTECTSGQCVYIRKEGSIRKRLNGITDCNDLYLQYDITFKYFDGSAIFVEYLYDKSKDLPHCSGSVTWSTLAIHNNTDFVDQFIIKIPCSDTSNGSLSIQFRSNTTSNQWAFVDNVYMCNGRNWCPAPYPTTSPTPDPTIPPSIYPTNDPTAEPTNDPVAEPTMYPTSIPTIPPSIDPTNDPTTEPTNDPVAEPTLYPTSIPTVDPSYPTSPPTRSTIAYNIVFKEGYNCFDGYQDLDVNDPNYGKYCEECPDGTAGTVGKCYECGLFQVPNDPRNSCEYYQPWWLWLAETVFGIGIIGIIIWCCQKARKSKKRIQTERHMSNEMTMGNTYTNYA